MNKELRLVMLFLLISFCSCTNQEIVGNVTKEVINKNSFDLDNNQVNRNTRQIEEFQPDCEKENQFTTKGFIEGVECEFDDIEEANKFYLPPEYSETRSVIISDKIAEFQEGNNLIQSIINTNNNVWLYNKNRSYYFSIKENVLDNNKTSFDNQNLNRISVNSETIWARDYSPLFSVNSKKELKLIDLNYYSDRQVDDSASRQLKQNINKGRNNNLKLDLKRVSLPIFMEGGNIMCNSNDCYITDIVLEQNSYAENSSQIILDENEIKEEFKKQLKQKIWFVGQMPYEGTKHIDMWAKFLNENTLIIGEISDKTLNSVSKNDFIINQEIKEFLDIQANGFDKLGNKIENSLANIAKKNNPNLKIVRLPMPSAFEYASSESDFDRRYFYPEDYNGIFRTYTNSFLMNNYAFLPKYTFNYDTNEKYPDNLLIKEYEETVEKVYKDAGYKIVWVNSDSLISLGGSIHCVTMQVPN